MQIIINEIPIDNDALYITYKSINTSYDWHIKVSQAILEKSFLEEEFNKLTKVPKRVIAIGGGTVLDYSKYFKYKWLSLGHNPELIAIPTTAGTGSEATTFSVYYDNKVKLNLDDPRLLPDKVALIPELVFSVPESVRLATALDALCQSIEAMWAVSSNKESSEYAKEALSLCAKYLVSYIQAPNLESSRYMQKAAYLSGKAINISKTTLAHALSYHLTSNHGISHGLAVFICMESVMDFNLNIDNNSCIDPRKYEFVKVQFDETAKSLGLKSKEEILKYIQWLKQELKILTKLKNYAPVPYDPSRAMNNPRDPKLFTI